MKTYFECIPCFFKQALEAAKLSGADKKTQKKILDKVALSLPDFPLSASPPEMARIIHGIIRKITGRRDPYLNIKEKSNNLALKAYPRLKEKMSRSKDKLLTAVELAIAGNIIDYGVKNSINVREELDKILKKENLAIKKEGTRIFNYKGFKRAIARSDNILYLADNAGEVVFDRILIEQIKKKKKGMDITYAVKEMPVINDALERDARVAGIQEYAAIISSGADTPGTVLSRCSREFVKLYRRAGMVISKGQGNFEALSNSKRQIFFLFMAKCPVVAGHVKCKMGDIVLMFSNPKY